MSWNEEKTNGGEERSTEEERSEARSEAQEGRPQEGRPQEEVTLATAYAADAPSGAAAD
jgi:hypothetical protein